jgi:hypothetical protein
MSAELPCPLHPTPERLCLGCRRAAVGPATGLGGGAGPRVPRTPPSGPLGVPVERRVTLYSLDKEERGYEAVTVTSFLRPGMEEQLFITVMVPDIRTGLALTPRQAREMAIALIEEAASVEETERDGCDE